MPPLAADGVCAANDLSVDHDAAAHTGAEDHAEHHRGALPRTIDRLREREAIRVVFQPDRSAQCFLEILSERLADQPGRVRVLDQAGRARLRAGNADTDGALPDFLHQRFDPRDSPRVIAARRGNPPAENFAPRAIERERFDLRAAEVDTYSQVTIINSLTLPPWEPSM